MDKIIREIFTAQQVVELLTKKVVDQHGDLGVLYEGGASIQTIGGKITSITVEVKAKGGV